MYVGPLDRVNRPLGRVVKGESGVQSHSDLDGVGSIPAIPNARYVPSLLCHERFDEASLPVCRLTPVKIFFRLQLQIISPSVSLHTFLRVQDMVLCVVWMF